MSVTMSHQLSELERKRNALTRLQAERIGLQSRIDSLCADIERIETAAKERMGDVDDSPETSPSEASVRLAEIRRAVGL